MNETNWRSPFLGIGMLASAFGIYVLFNDQGSLGFRAGAFAGGFLSAAVIASPLFLLWRFALKTGRSQPLGAALNIFVVLALSIWLFLFVIAKQALPGLVERTGTSSLESDLDTEGWTQEDTGSSEIGPWLQYDPPGTRYCRYHNGTIQRLYPPNVKPDAKKANIFCLPGSTLAELN